MSTATENPPPNRDKKVVAAIVIVVVLVGVALAIFLHRRSPASAIGGPFTLTSSNGQKITEKNFAGKYRLIYFGYTFCPDVCPTTMANLAIAMKKLGTKSVEVQPLFITIDPVRDTPDVLKAYTAEFWPGLIGLTGTPEQIARVEKEYHVYTETHRTGPGPNDYQMDHSSIFYLMDRDGEFVTVIPADSTPAALAADITNQIQ